jgi:muconolactone delta-isomerase
MQPIAAVIFLSVGRLQLRMNNQLVWQGSRQEVLSPALRIAYPFMDVEVTALCRHPGSLEPEAGIG